MLWRQVTAVVNLRIFIGVPRGIVIYTPQTDGLLGGDIIVVSLVLHHLLPLIPRKKKQSKEW